MCLPASAPQAGHEVTQKGLVYSVEVFESIKTVGSILSAAMVIISFAGVIIKPIRKWIVRKIKDVADVEESTQELTEVKELIVKLDTSIGDRLTKMEARIDEQAHQLSASMEADKAALANTIKHIYMKYCDTKKLPLREKETLVVLHKAYKGVHGNTFIDELYAEMMSWETI